MSESTLASSIFTAPELGAVLFESAPEAIVIVDSSGLIIRANAPCATLFSYERQELSGKKLELIVPDGQKCIYTQARHGFTASSGLSKNAKFETYGRKKDGTELPVHITFASITTEAGVAVVAIVNDNTMGNEEKQSLQRWIEQRKGYVAVLAHELEAPLLEANSAIKFLMNGQFGPINDSQHDVLQCLSEINDSMSNELRTILDLYCYDSGVKKLSLGLHDLRSLISELISEVTPLAERQNIRVECSVPSTSAMVECDAVEIGRVLQNLMNNAIKFTPSGGLVRIDLSDADFELIVTVSDPGRGISKNEQENLMQRFGLANENGRQYASTGLGMYLCREIIEQHGGRIWLGSEPGSGSSFQFSIRKCKN